MGGMCLGMSKREVDSKLESIIEFSEQREVIDLPLKTYSTGMQARLTFSVAISVDPDILIVDEALSVGDARFQLKCFTRLQQLRANSTTILLVSHDTNTITALCDRALILEGGRVYADGDGKQMSIAYHNLLFGEVKSPTKKNKKMALTKSSAGTHGTAQIQASPAIGTNASLSPSELTVESVVRPRVDGGLRGESDMRYGTGEARLVDWGILDASRQRCQVIESGKACRM